MPESAQRGSDGIVLSQDASQRIDILKVWLTVMVIFIHIYSVTIKLNSGNIVLDVPEWLSAVKWIVSQCICRCAVPAFFLISAFFLYRKPLCWKENIQKKSRTLLVPYFLLNTFWIIFYFCCQHLPGLDNFFANPENIVASWDVLGWLKAYGIFSSSPLLYPLWFLKYLFILNVFAGVFLKVIRRIPRLSAFCLLAVWLMCQNSYLTQAVCFWGLGCFCCVERLTPEQLDRVHKPLLSLAYFLLIAAAALTRNGQLGAFLVRVGILVGIPFWYVCATDFRSQRNRMVFCKLSGYIFPIFLFHEMHLTILKKAAAKVLVQTPLIQLALYLLVPAAIFGYCLLLSAAMKKYLPRVYSVLTGGRVR